MKNAINAGHTILSDDSTVLINEELYKTLCYLGIIPDGKGIRSHNVGKSDYSMNLIQPWTIWLAYPNLTPWDHDIIKRILRTKSETNLTRNEARILDYEKIIHICEERIRQLNYEIN